MKNKGLYRVHPERLARVQDALPSEARRSGFIRVNPWLNGLVL